MAVMIPVGIFVIAPKMAQSSINQSLIHILSNEVYGIPIGDYNGYVHNELNLHSPMFLSAKIHAANVTMVANQPGATLRGSAFTSGPIGWFTQPEAQIKQGDNLIKFDAPIHFNSTADNGNRWVGWGMFVGLSGVAYVDLVAEPQVTAMGFITMKTKLRKTVQCNCAGGIMCLNPKSYDKKYSVPNTLFSEDDAYGEPLFDNKTHDPPPFNASGSYMPNVSIFCQPVKGYNVSGGPPKVSIDFGALISGWLTV